MIFSSVGYDGIAVAGDYVGTDGCRAKDRRNTDWCRSSHLQFQRR